MPSSEVVPICSSTRNLRVGHRAYLKNRYVEICFKITLGSGLGSGRFVSNTRLALSLMKFSCDDGYEEEACYLFYFGNVQNFPQ